MAESRNSRDPSDALSRAATFAMRPMAEPPLGEMEAEADSVAVPTFDGEDFLFHLYRGSELLQDNYVEEAKEELERALRMQPRDTEGQGLLGVVYFRLGLYPRAIEIYEEIIRSCPNDITPRINLGLCYIKTGQHLPARDSFEQVIRLEPQHKRAWGYLGLVFERLGEYAKAQASFERAGQPHLARRMEQRIEELTGTPNEPPPEQNEMRRAAADAALELDGGEAEPFSRADGRGAVDPSGSGRWRAVEPGETAMPPPPRRPSGVPRAFSLSPPEEFQQPPAGPLSLPPSALVQGSVLEPPTGVHSIQHRPGVASVRVEVGFAVRHGALVALTHETKPFRRAALLRRARGRETEEGFGGPGGAWSLLEGTGFLTLSAQRDRVLTLIDLTGEFVYLREAAVIGFDSAVRYENGRLPGTATDPVPMVQFSGQGLVLVETERRMSSTVVGADKPLLLRAERVLGWTGRLLAHPVEPEVSPTHAAGFVAFTGDGAVLLDVG
jgi:Flp pilus assembly protein TadD